MYVQNNTGADLSLYDIGTLIIELNSNGNAEGLPITVTSVSRAAVIYANRQGSFVANLRYSAEFDPATNMVVFIEDPSNPKYTVTFS